MDLDPFATSSDLATRLGATFTVEQAARIDELLADSCDELRDIIGQPLNRLTSTVTLYTDQVGIVILPAVPVVEVETVTVDDVEVEWSLKDDMLIVPCTVGRRDAVVVTYTHGWDPIPRTLVKWACVMAMAVYAGSAKTGALGTIAGVGRRQESIDDYMVIIDSPTSDDTASTALSLPEPIIRRLRSAYGGRANAWWVEV